MGEFMFVIRKRMKIPEVSIYLFVGQDNLAPVSHTMGMIYDKHRDDDKFLYIRYIEKQHSVKFFYWFYI